MSHKLYELEEAINQADSIAFDGCHKIYIQLDEKQTQKMRDYEYENIITADESNPYDMFEKVKTWYDDSCGLRFIYAVANGEEEDEFFSIVSQMEDLYNNDEEEDDWEDEEEWDDDYE